MINGIDNLKEMSLRLNKFTLKCQTITEIPGIERRPRSWRERQSGVGPLCYMILRWKPEQTFVFKILYAEYLNFHSLA